MSFKTFDEWWASRSLSGQTSMPLLVESIKLECKLAWDESRRIAPEEADIMHRLYQRLAPLAFMPTEVSKEEAKRLGYPHVRLHDVEMAIRAELSEPQSRLSDLRTIMCPVEGVCDNDECRRTQKCLRTALDKSPSAARDTSTEGK